MSYRILTMTHNVQLVNKCEFPTNSFLLVSFLKLWMPREYNDTNSNHLGSPWTTKIAKYINKYTYLIAYIFLNIHTELQKENCCHCHSFRAEDLAKKCLCYNKFKAATKLCKSPLFFFYRFHNIFTRFTWFTYLFWYILVYMIFIIAHAKYKILR